MRKAKVNLINLLYPIIIGDKMDLTKEFPRSPYDMMAGIVMLPRTLDKCKAYLANTLGEYHYNCPLDEGLFEFLGVGSEEFAKKVKESGSDEKIEKWARDKLKDKSQEEKDQFNNRMRHSIPEDEESQEWLESEKKRIGKDNYFSYFDNIDADEGRF